MKDRNSTLLLLLGGAVFGGFTGIFLGGALGAVYGLLVGDVSLGLDGAIVVGICLVLAGALYGALVAARDPKPREPLDHAAAEEGAKQTRQACLH
jgi:hypothetical protein